MESEYYALNILESHYANLLNNQAKDFYKMRLQITIISHTFMLNDVKRNLNNLEEKTG